MDFRTDQIERYSRHILLQDIGVEGQQKIRRGRVLVVGAGGLGSPALLYLAAAGVGRLGVVDGDVVELSNLQRQVIHFTPDAGKNKALSAAEKIRLLNPDVEVVACAEYLTAENAPGLIGGYDFIIDGTDSFAAKFLLNDACVLGGKAFSHGGILRFEGQTLTHRPGTACYRCAFHGPPPPHAVPSCSQAGVLGAIAGMLGTIQAAEALKFLTGAGELLTNRLLSFEAKGMNFRTLAIRRNERCPVCGKQPTITSLHQDGEPACDLGKNRIPHA